MNFIPTPPHQLDKKIPKRPSRRGFQSASLASETSRPRVTSSYRALNGEDGTSSLNNSNNGLGPSGDGQLSNFAGESYSAARRDTTMNGGGASNSGRKPANLTNTVDNNPQNSSYDSPDKHDGNSSLCESDFHKARDEGNVLDLSPRTNRRQIRSFIAASDDCWGANLSDDDILGGTSPKPNLANTFSNGHCSMPLEWEANMVRREMMKNCNKQAGRRSSILFEDDVESYGTEADTGTSLENSLSDFHQETEREKGANNNQLENPSLRNRRRSKDNIAFALCYDEGEGKEKNSTHLPADMSRSKSSTDDENLETPELSLPELLLQKRLKRKQKLQKAQAKHELFVRYQKQQEKQNHEQQQQKLNDNEGNIGRNNRVKEKEFSPNKPQHLRTPSIKSASSKLSPSTEAFLHQHLQSACKTIPRASSPLFPDDDLDDDNDNNDIEFPNQSPSATSSPSRDSFAQSPLHSLPRKPICPMPDESDRKRVVGCLAAILATSYGYETAPKLMVRERVKIADGAKIDRDEAVPRIGAKVGEKQSFGHWIKEPGRSDGDERNVGTATVLGSDQYGDGIAISTHQPQNAAILTDVHNDFIQQQTCHKDYIQQKSAPQQQVIDKQTQLDQQNHLTHLRQRQFQVQRTNYFQVNMSGNHSRNMMNRNWYKNQARSFNEGKPINPPRSSSSFTINPSLSLASLTTSFDKPIGWQQNNTPTLSDELAEVRHRIRRHAVLSDLLVSSAEMLMLDSSHAKAFLPMLEGLSGKVDDEEAKKRKNDRSVNSSWVGRGFGGGGIPSGGSYATGNASIKRSVSSEINDRKTHHNEQQHAPQSMNPVHEHPPVKAALLSNGDSKSESTFMSQSKPPPPTSHTPTSTHYTPLDTVIVEKEMIAPFLQTLTPGAGFRCIALLLLNHLLRDGRGYDARVRQAFKRLAVVVLSHELKVGGILRVDLEDEEDLDALLWREGKRSAENNTTEDEEDDSVDTDELALLASRKFEALEHAIAAKLIAMSENQDKNHSTRKKKNDMMRSSKHNKPSLASSPSNSTHGRIALAPKEMPLSSQHGISREQLMRGLKIGTAGAVGATLFALTGGLAAPGIAAGLAAVAGGSAVAAGMTTVLSSAAAISTIFGVGGAGLAGYKMHRRTKGLTEFDFQKEGSMKGKNRMSEAELFSTVCISGWLRDSRDFQRPWGVSPNHPRIIDKVELLERFYFVHNPDNVHRCAEILRHWKGRYFQLWKALREKYGRDPSNLYPLDEGPRISAELTHEETEAVEFLLDKLGYSPQKDRSTHDETSPIDRMKANNSFTGEDLSSRSMVSSTPETKKLQCAQKELKDSSLKQQGLLQSFGVSSPDVASISTNLSLFAEETDASTTSSQLQKEEAKPESSKRVSESTTEAAKKSPPKHLLTVWDYHADYGGELYTVRWESELLMELCDSVADQMIEWGISATKTILHTTALATLMTAITLPYSLVVAANAIDNSWAMAMERADRAGVELAKSLIDSTAGHRPVTLVGFSMGARVIYSCLKELARHQEVWEDQQQKRKMKSSAKSSMESSNAKGEEELKYIREPASIIEDAILMGTPNHVSLRSWEACRRVVAGRLINCYSRKDLILSLMFQLKRFQGILRPVCGTSPVSISGVENYDITDLVSAHTDYCLVTGEILKRVKHGQPQRASVNTAEVDAMVTSINVTTTNNGKDALGFASLSDEIHSQRRPKHGK